MEHVMVTRNFSLDPREIVRVTDSGTRAEIMDPGGRPDETEQDHIKIVGNGTNRQVTIEADNDDSAVVNTGLAFLAKGADFQVGSVPTASIALGIVATEYGGLGYHRTRFTLTAVAVSITDDGSAGAWGTVQLYDFPAGDIQTTYGRQTLTVVAATGSNMTSAVIDVGVGQSALAAAALTLSGDYENIINKDDITLSSGALSQAETVLEASTDVITGNTTAAGGSANAHLNIACAEDTTGGDDTLTITGEIDILWFNYGDY